MNVLVERLAFTDPKGHPATVVTVVGEGEEGWDRLLDFRFSDKHRRLFRIFSALGGAAFFGMNGENPTVGVVVPENGPGDVTTSQGVIAILRDTFGMS